ncbi:hypothetical protein PFLmoz3_03310 [Pseudomonas fluorescens]|uniref:Uncharacterized protein n=1 Tax=Pseudomonas fluorescens TaxID=294 RepID=A0A120G7L5_PSEFL|nr:hypothetical protein PFLmoz3_03310 [Pseudomonas fluorescens]
MIVARLAASGSGLSWIGEQACRSAQLKSKVSSGGHSGRLIVGTPTGTPGAIADQSSSLPISANRACE